MNFKKILSNIYIYRRGCIRSPESYLKKSLNFFKLNGSYALAKISLYSCLIAGLLSYHMLVINKHGNPDAVAEGLVSYKGADWALACGRWATRYMSGCSFDIIMPGIRILLYMLTVFLVVILLSKMWCIRSKLSICLASVLLAVNPAVIEQSLLQYMFLAWGLSNLLCTLFVYFNYSTNSKIKQFILAPMCMAVAFGFYQASVGYVCICFGMSLTLNCLKGADMKDLAKKVLRFFAASILGVLLYFAVMRYELARYGVEESSRVDAFSIKAIFTSLVDSVPAAYKIFYGYFADYFFYRKLLYTVLAIFMILLFARSLFLMAREKNYAGGLISVLLLCMFPLLANASKLIFPDTDIKLLMQYQNNLIVPFIFALLEANKLRVPEVYNLTRIVIYCVTTVLCWGYIVSANATYNVYELTYRHINFVTESILNDVYNMPDYSEDDTIVFAGFIDDSELRNSISAYKFAYGQYDNLVYWTDAGTGLRQSRNNYLLNYFGINGGYIRGTMHGAYNDAVQSQEFAEMTIYPGENSIRRFDNMIIVKLSEEPPLFN